MRKQWFCFLPGLLLPLGNAVLLFSAHCVPDPLFCLKLSLAAVLEECLFRWLLLDRVLLHDLHISPVLAVVTVSLLFSGLHAWNAPAVSGLLLQLFCAFAFGIWSGAVVVRYQRLWPPLLSHLVLNFSSSFLPENMLSFYDVLLLFLLAAALLGCGFLILFRRKETSCK